jgi:hypothetical protein
MKKLILIALVGLAGLGTISSCKKNNSGDNNNNNNGGGGNTGNLVTVPIDRSDTTSLTQAIPGLPISLDFMNVSAIPGSGPMTIDTFATKVDEYITPYGFAKKDIQSVTLTALSINIENAPSQYFNFVKDTTPISIKVLVDSFNGTSPKMVAFKESVPRNINQMQLTVDPSDIKDYFNADYMKIMIGFYTQENEELIGTAKFRVNYSFKIIAKMP